jgi:hypothetical protein
MAIWYILGQFGIFFVAIWNILWQFGIFCGNLINFKVIWYLFSVFVPMYVVARKIWQPWLSL